MLAVPVARRHESPLDQFKDGFDYAYTHRPIRAIILYIALVCLVGVPYAVLMPIYAGAILHGGPHTLGFLMTASGAGAQQMRELVSQMGHTHAYSATKARPAGFSRAWAIAVSMRGLLGRGRVATRRP